MTSLNHGPTGTIRQGRVKKVSFLRISRLSERETCIVLTQTATVLSKFRVRISSKGSHGVMVSTLDFESSDPSSNLGGTFIHKIFFSSPAAAWSGDAYGFQPVT